MGRSAAPKHPFFSIWIAPRATVRAILDTDPSRGVIVLAMLCGAAFVFVAVTAIGIVARDGSRPALSSIAIDGPIVGLLALFFVARALAWSGQSFLGGKATDRDLRAAPAWTATFVLWISAFAAAQVFLVDRFVTDDAALHRKFFLALAGLSAVVAFVGLVLFFKAVGEAHGFSAWKAIAATFIALLAFALVLALPVGSLVLILELL